MQLVQNQFLIQSMMFWMCVRICALKANWTPIEYYEDFPETSCDIKMASHHILRWAMHMPMIIPVQRLMLQKILPLTALAQTKGVH